MLVAVLGGIIFLKFDVYATQTEQTEQTSNGWDDEKKSYYVDGKKVTGFREIDGLLYYFDKNGKKQKNNSFVSIEGKSYYISKDGEVARGYKTIKNKCYYFNLKTGVQVFGWKKIDGLLYYFNDDTGVRHAKKGWKTIDGKTYYFNDDFSAKIGFIKIKGNTYYLDKKGVKREKSGWLTINNKRYYFKQGGIIQTGWARIKNKRYYLDAKKNGAAVVGWKYIGDLKYYFNENGQLVQDVRSIIGKRSSYYIKVNKKSSCVTVYTQDGKNGYKIPVVSFVCSAGKNTPIGTFNTLKKYRWQELVGPCWGQWCTLIVSDILFHSVFYDSERNNKSLNVKAYNDLGTMASKGCIRLTAGDAKWIYDNCNIGTTVTIYNSKNPGPFDKPKAQKLPAGHTWDPTDPAFKK